MQSHRGRICQSDDSLIQRRQLNCEAARSIECYFYDRCLRSIFAIEMVTGRLRQKHYAAASLDSTKNYGCEYTLCSDAMYISVDIWASGPLSFGERCVVVEK